MSLMAVIRGRLTLLKCIRRDREGWRRCYSSRNILKLEERGMIADLFPNTGVNEISDLVKKKTQTVYAGFDPTADSLHIGNLLVMLNLFHWQRGGHEPIFLIGGATARIGDPSGKKKEREPLFHIEVDRNTKEIESLLMNIINNHEEMYSKKHNKKLPPIRIVNNLEWYDSMSALEFVRNIGQHFRVGTMLGKQSVRERMESSTGISYTEFSYQILQAYDWLHLLENYNCYFQIGGNDQLGNIVAGHDLIKRVHKKNVYGIMVPLVTNEDGDKYGKTGGNAVWLSRQKTTAFQLYQFFIRAKDSEVQKLLMLYTFESVPRILEIMNEHWKSPEKRIAQKVVAEHVTELIHGAEGLDHAQKITSVLYEKSLEALKNLEPADFRFVFEGATLVELLLKPGWTILDVALNAKCFLTESDALRIISAGGFYINQEKVQNFQEVLTPAAHILPSNVTLLRVGKKNYTIVKWL